jgi:hypothetical protein
VTMTCRLAGSLSPISAQHVASAILAVRQETSYKLLTRGGIPVHGPGAGGPVTVDAQSGVTQAGGPAGITPSCCIIDSWSMTPQCSWQSPSSPMPMMSMSCASTLLPVAGMPMKAPWCVPV